MVKVSCHSPWLPPDTSMGQYSRYEKKKNLHYINVVYLTLLLGTIFHFYILCLLSKIAHVFDLQRKPFEFNERRHLKTKHSNFETEQVQMFDDTKTAPCEQMLIKIL